MPARSRWIAPARPPSTNCSRSAKAGPPSNGAASASTCWAALLQGLAELQAGLARLERALPDAAGLNSFPLAAYGLFRARHRLPPPPEPPPALRWGVLAIDTGQGDALALLHALAAQDIPPVGVALAGRGEGAEALLRRFGFGGLACPVTLPPPGSEPLLPACDWVLAITTAGLPAPGALAWLGWAAAQVGAAAIYADEDHVAAPGAAPERPVLKAAHDPDAQPPLHAHGMLALRAPPRPLLAAALATPDPLAALAAATAASGLAHLPRILSSRLADPPAPPPHPTPAPAAAPAAPARIGVIIPTRNGALLRTCLDALRATAGQPEALDVVVLDNGSDDAATLALLEGLAAAGAATVLRDDTPFNWARLSNRGAAACRAPLLLFLNDDVEITSPGWDATLRRHLARPGIGALGARLAYPQGGLQHAGMVLGPDGRAEHEGVAPVGVPADIAARWRTAAASPPSPAPCWPAGARRSRRPAASMKRTCRSGSTTWISACACVRPGCSCSTSPKSPPPTTNRGPCARFPRMRKGAPSGTARWPRCAIAGARRWPPIPASTRISPAPAGRSRRSRSPPPPPCAPTSRRRPAPTPGLSFRRLLPEQPGMAQRHFRQQRPPALPLQDL